MKHISDLLHCLKIARKRLLICDITLFSNRIDHTINSDNLESLLLVGQTLTDKSPLGKMKDFYVLNLFNFENLDKLFAKNCLYELLYCLPYACWAEAATNANLNRQNRIELLRIAFDILFEFLKQNLYCTHSKGITYNHPKNSMAILFADSNFLKRSLNSILGLAHILYFYPDVGIDRIGTHVLENFFGQIRYSCDNYDS